MASKRIVTRDGGVPPSLNLGKPVEEKVLKEMPFEQHLKLFTEQHIKAPQSCIIIVAPILEKRTKANIYIPESALTDEMKQEAVFKWHRVLSVGSNISDIKVGDEIWMDVQKFQPSRIAVNDIAYMKIDYYIVNAIRPFNTKNYENK